ncbi:MAG: flagellar biosynthetic protein FliO [Myxococcales bacterium]|nr:flagellar biosynthetic protein FliO [Myxococcales bacterium]
MSDYSAQLWRLIAVFAAICVVLLIAWRWGLRRTESRVDGLIEVLGRMPLGPQKALLVVRVLGRVLLLGIADHQVSLLKEFEDDAHVAIERIREMASEKRIERTAAAATKESDTDR